MSQRLARKDDNRMFVAIRNMGVLLASGALLAGCISLGNDSPEQLIVLSADARVPAGDIGKGAPGEAIVVLDPETDRRLDVLRVPVQLNASTVAYLKDAAWVEKPARQFRRLLAETIRAKSGKVVVEGDTFDQAGALTVSGRLSEMGYDAQEGSVIVRFDAVVESGDGTLRSRRFETEIGGVPAKAAAVAPALNEAANTVAHDVSDWLAE